MVKRLEGKRVLVVGATGSLGSDFCRALVAQGAAVVAAGRTPSRLDTLAAELRRSGGSVETVVADVGSEPETLAEKAWAAFGGLEVVVSNAIPSGSGDPQGDLLSTAEPLWQDFYDVIVHGPRRMMRVLAPLMRDLGGGSFVSIVSSTGVRPQPGYDAYGLAKGSLLLLTQYMAKEWGPWRIRANAINPGSIASPESIEEFTELARSLGVLDRVSLQRVGTNPEVIGALVYLVSDESSYVSGQCLTVDGGRF